MRTIYDKKLMELREEKRQQENTKRQNRKFLGEDIYTTFCLWCNAFKNGKGFNDYNLFKEFLREQNETLNELQEKHLKEKYFMGE